MSPGTPNNPINCGQGFTIRRRYEQPRRKEEVSDGEEAVETEVWTVVRKSPGSRSRWLQTALMQAARGKLGVSAVYDVIIHDAFALGVDEVVGGQIYSILVSNLHLFGTRQQRHLQSPEFLLSRFAGARGRGAEGRSGSGFEKKFWEDERGREAGGGDGRDRKAREHDESSGDTFERRARYEEEPRTAKRRRTMRDGEDESADGESGGHDSSRARPKTRARSAGRSHGSRHRELQPQVSSESGNEAVGRTVGRRDPVPHVQTGPDFDRKIVSSSLDGQLSSRDHPDEGRHSRQQEQALADVRDVVRKQSVEAAASAAFLGMVLVQIRSVGLHALQKCESGVIGACNGRVKSLQSKFFNEAQNAGFSKRLSGFRAKKETGLSFLQHVLALLEQSNFKAAEADAALFLGLIIILLPDKSLRTALNDKVITVKKQLEEGIIDSWHKQPQ